jgi:hypothetical protein
MLTQVLFVVILSVHHGPRIHDAWASVELWQSIRAHEAVVDLMKAIHRQNNRKDRQPDYVWAKSFYKEACFYTRSPLGRFVRKGILP